MKRIALLIVVTLLLAACFKSERLLLDLGSAAHPVAEGDWVAGEGDDVFKLTIKDDHYLRVEGQNHYDVVITPLAGHKDTYVAAESSEGCTGHDATPECTWEYAIVLVGEDGNWKQFAPDCKQSWDGMDHDVAKSEDDGETCWFDNAAGLQHALAIAADRGGGDQQQEFHRPGATPPEPTPPEPTPAPEEEPATPPNG
jgi:hypothetical protein